MIQPQTSREPSIVQHNLTGIKSTYTFWANQGQRKESLPIVVVLFGIFDLILISDTWEDP